ncbi:hypothetical protein HD806DRAFT_551424 [Xylariaceae sp. AK1471]|nr:hypothetical protein HD806DRAFT_551424 [Xylariaceae sp. AK1471]
MTKLSRFRLSRSPIGVRLHLLAESVILLTHSSSIVTRMRTRPKLCSNPIAKTVLDAIWAVAGTTGPGDEVGSVQVSMASFEEWLLPNAVLTHVIVDGLATFQLQFTWDSCASYKRKYFATGNRSHKSLVKDRCLTKRGAAMRLVFTPEEDDHFVELKNQGLSWKEIHMQFREAFHGESGV